MYSTFQLFYDKSMKSIIFSDIKVVTFDVTGTLIKVKGSVGKQYSDILHKHLNLSYCHKRLQESFIASYKHHSKHIPLFGYHDSLDCKSWWQSVFLSTVFAVNATDVKFHDLSQIYKNISNKKLVEVDSSAVNDLLLAAFDDVYHNFEWDVLPHSIEVLSHLKMSQEQKRLKNGELVLGVISNNDCRLIQTLKKLKMLPYFDFVTTSYDAGFEKPDSNIFKAALETAEQIIQCNIQPNELLHIGNELKKDYKAAQNFGSHSILIDKNTKFDSSHAIHPDHLMTDVLDLKDRFSLIDY